VGAWGEGIFENDDAGDFASEVAETSGLSRVEEALDAVLETSDYLEAPAASEGLAAADIVAFLRGHAGQPGDYPEELDEWAKRTKLLPSENVLRKALLVVDRVRTEPSELLELCSEGDPTKWLATLDALKQRLTDASSSQNM
jgi:hypothetical protein